MSINYFQEILKIARENGFADDRRLCDSCRNRRFSCTNSECLAELQKRFEKKKEKEEQISLF